MRRAFLSPYGGIGASDKRTTNPFKQLAGWFQSPYGGRGRSDHVSALLRNYSLLKFQSPYGGIGASDNLNNVKNQNVDAVSITLRWHRCIRHLIYSKQYWINP